VVSDKAIVRDVGVGHDQRVAAHAGEPAAFDRAAINCDELANLIVIADFETGGLARVGQVLRRHPDRTEWEETIVRADPAWAFDGHVRNQAAVFAQFHFRADHAIRADLAGGMNLGARINDGRGMNTI